MIEHSGRAHLTEPAVIWAFIAHRGPATVPRSVPRNMTPEENAREQIDAMLVASGWAVQDYKQFTD